MAARTEPVSLSAESLRGDAVRYVGPGIDEALAELLRRLSALRTRLRLKGKEKAPPPDEASPTREESERTGP